jgi:ACDE family multidrug resistance protein
MLSDPRLLVLLLAGSLTTMTGGVVAPILPEMVQQLNLEPGLAAHLVSIHCLTIAIFSPLLGILADRTGRLRVLITSLLFYALFGTAAVMINSIESLLVIRGLLGIATGGIAAASLGLLASMYEGAARSQALGQATSAITIAGIIFPVLGGWVGASDWRAVFYLYGLGVPLAILVKLVLKDKPPRRTQGKATKKHEKLSQVLRHGYVLWLLLSLSLASIAMTTVVIYAPLYLKITIGAGAILNGFVLASRAVGAAIVSALGTKRLGEIIGLDRSVAIGFLLMALTLATIPFLGQLSVILPTAVLFGIGFGIVLPNLYSALSNLAPAKLRSSVLATGTGAGFLGQFFCPILLGPVLRYISLEAVFYAAAGICVVTALLQFITPTSIISDS